MQREITDKETGVRKNNPNADLRALAHLRRAAQPIDAAREPQTLELHRRLEKVRHGNDYQLQFNQKRLETTAVVAHVLALIREEPQPSAKTQTATLLGSGDPKVMSEIRFQNLVKANTPADVMREFRAAIALLRNQAPVEDVAISILDWLDDTEWAESRKLQWLYAYHNQPNSAP